MIIQLYTIADGERGVELNEYSRVKLLNKKLDFLPIQSIIREGTQHPLELKKSFTYEFISPEYKEYEKYKKLNTKIRIDGNSNEFLANLKWYQRLYISWTFNKTIIQRWETVKWIIGLIVGFASGLLFAWLRFKC